MQVCTNCGNGLIEAKKTRSDNLIYSDLKCSVCGKKAKTQVINLLDKHSAKELE